MDDRALQQLPLFAGLNRKARRRVAQLADEIDVEAGRELAKEGDLAYELFVIQEGRAVVSQSSAEIGDLGPGDFFGEIALMAGEPRRTATVVASSPMRLAVLRGSDVRVLERELPTVARQIRAAIEDRLANG